MDAPDGGTDRWFLRELRIADVVVGRERDPIRIAAELLGDAAEPCGRHAQHDGRARIVGVPRVRGARRSDVGIPRV